MYGVFTYAEMSRLHLSIAVGTYASVPNAPQISQVFCILALALIELYGGCQPACLSV
jgi:hypothetical protein